MTSQLLANAIISASLIFIVACGFALIYRVTRCFHFAHAIVFTAGAYVAFLFHRLIGLPLSISVVITVVLTAILGATIEVGLYRALRRKGALFLPILLASLGLYVASQNAVSLCFGDDVKTIRSAAAQEGMSVLGARITPTQIATVLAAAITLVGLTTILRWSGVGKAMRATASDGELARSSGIDTDRLGVWAFAIGSALAGIAGVLAALDTDMTPSMGMDVFMLCIVAVIVGGLHSIPGIALGALLLGMALHFGAWKIGSQWQDAIAFFILIAFLLVRPEGVMGKKLRKATV